MTTESLYLIRMDLELPRLFSLCERQRLPPVDDLGYAVHCGLAACLGEEAPSLFAVAQARERTLELLA